MSFSKRSNPVTIDELKPGMAIIAIEAQNGPVKLRKSGLVKSQDMVNGLKEMGVLSLNIDWDNSIEIDDTPSLTADLPPHSINDSLDSPMTTRQLFDDEHTRHVNNAMSDQFNRSLFLPSLQALPSQFSVIGKYSAQYVGIALVGLALGYGAAKLLPVPHKAVVAVSSETPELPVTAVVEEPVPEATPEPAVPEDIVGQTLPAKPIMIPDEEQGKLVTQTQEEAPVSAAMAARVNRALESLGGLDNLTAAVNNDGNIRPSASTERATTIEVVDNVQGIAQLPEHLLIQLPAMVFSAHMYSSTDEDRWVRVNNRRLQEGGRIDNNVRIVRIEPQYVVLSFRGTEFKMAALTDW